MENHLGFLVLVQDPQGSYCPLTLVAVNLRKLILHHLVGEMTRRIQWNLFRENTIRINSPKVFYETNHSKENND